MFRHCVLMRFAPTATPEQRHAVHDALAELAPRIPEIRAYRIGFDAGINEGNHDFAVVADFDDVAGYRAYADHPEHVAIVTDLIRPILAERAAVQFEVADA